MAAHRHKFVSAPPYRVCRECRVVQRQVSGQWRSGAAAANPTEAKNVARRALKRADREVDVQARVEAPWFDKSWLSA